MKPTVSSFKRLKKNNKPLARCTNKDKREYTQMT